MPKTATKNPAQAPSRGYIDQGIQAAQNYANTAGRSPSASQGIQDARKMAGGLNKIASNPSVEGMKSAGHALLKGIKGNKRNPKEETRRQKMQKELINRGKKVLDSKVREIAMANAAETFGLSIVAYYAVKHWKVTIALLASIGLLLFAIFDQQQVFDAPSDQNATTPIASDTCSPTQFTGDAFGKTSVCTITLTDTASAQDVTITDIILPGTQYVCSAIGSTPCTQKNSLGSYDKTSNTITWNAQQLNLPLNPINITVTVTIRITTHQNNTTVYNAYSINPVGISGGSSKSTGGSSCTTTGSPDMEAKWQQVLQMGKQYGQPWINFLNGARSIAQKEDYPLVVIIAQGALESNHGRSNFAINRNNYFGYGAYTNDPNNAKSYPNAAASIEDYVTLIKNHYKAAYAARSDPAKMIQLIQDGGYADPPDNYAGKVMSIAEFKVLAGVTLPCN